MCDAGVDVSTHTTNLDIGTCGAQLHGTTRRTGADDGPGGQVIEAQSVTTDEDIGRVDPRRDGCHLDSRLGGGGQVLERVHGQVDLALMEGLADGGDEDSSAAEAGQGRHVDIALGDDLDDLDAPAGQCRDLVGDRRGLGTRQLGPAGAQTHGAAAEVFGFDDVEGVIGDRADAVGLDVVHAGCRGDLRLRRGLGMSGLVHGQVEELHECLGIVDFGFGHSEFLDLHGRGVDELLCHPVQRFADLCERFLVDGVTELLLQTLGLRGEHVFGVGTQSGHGRSDGSFLVSGGDVLQFGGDDGADFIDGAGDLRIAFLVGAAQKFADLPEAEEGDVFELADAGVDVVRKGEIDEGLVRGALVVLCEAGDDVVAADDDSAGTGAGDDEVGIGDLFGHDARGEFTGASAHLGDEAFGLVEGAVEHGDVGDALFVQSGHYESRHGSGADDQCIGGAQGSDMSGRGFDSGTEEGPSDVTEVGLRVGALAHTQRLLKRLGEFGGQGLVRLRIREC